MSEEMTFFVAAIDATAATNGGRGGHQGGEDGEQQRAAQVTAQVQRLRSAAIRVSIFADLSHSAVYSISRELRRTHNTNLPLLGD